MRMHIDIMEGPLDTPRRLRIACDHIAEMLQEDSLIKRTVAACALAVWGERAARNLAEAYAPDGVP